MFNFKEEKFFEIPVTERADVGEAPREDVGARCIGSSAFDSAA